MATRQEQLPQEQTVMSRPKRYLMRMTLFVIAVVLVGAALFPALAQAFEANPALNAVILAVLVAGIAYTFRSVLTLRPEIDWLEGWRQQREGRGLPASMPSPSLLAPMARMIGERQGRLSMSPQAMRSLLDGIAARLSESREISRYLGGLLIFLGLLGTFWGLLKTISSVGGVISGLTIGQGSDLATVFAALREGLGAPLSGMGMAFSSSLFGLAGSLVIGFLELQASQAQNRFYNELEDWLAGTARLTGGAPEGEGLAAETASPPVPAYLYALVQQTAENLDTLRRTVAQGEEDRRVTTAALAGLTERLGALGDHLRTQHTLMIRVAENQLELKPLLAQLAATASRDGGFGIDENTRAHIRTMAGLLEQMIADLASQRAQTVAEIRSDIKLLARTIAALAQEPEPETTVLPATAARRTP